MAHVEKAKALLEIEKARINQLLSILADISTQAALLAGCAVAAMSGESIDSFDDEKFAWKSLGLVAYVAFGAVALTSSLWVIFISSHLISLTRDSAMKENIGKAREILEDGVNEVREMQWVALLSLLGTCTSTAWLNMTLQNSILFSLVVAYMAWQAVLKRDDLTMSFYEKCGRGWLGESHSVGSFASAFHRPFRHSVLFRSRTRQHLVDRLHQSERRDDACDSAPGSPAHAGASPGTVGRVAAAAATPVSPRGTCVNPDRSSTRAPSKPGAMW